MVVGEERAFCVRNERGELSGVIVVSHEKNEIEWLAVASRDRNNGLGEILLQYAIYQLDGQRPMVVQTFAEGVPTGMGARKLYRKCGFDESEPAGLNPAGLPTVILRRMPG